MSSAIGNKVKVTLFGQSHSKGIGVVIDGLPAGKRSTLMSADVLNRRAPGKSGYVTRNRATSLP